MQPSKLRRMLVAVLALCLLLSFPFAARADECDHAYTGYGQGGFIVGGLYATLFELTGPSGAAYAYCADNQTLIASGSTYRRTNLEQADAFDADNAGKLRAIVRSAYPYITLEALRTRANLPDLTEQEAVTGVQMAIWRCIGGSEQAYDNANVTALYTYLNALEPENAAGAPVADVELTKQASIVGDTVTAIFRYKTDGVNCDGTPVSLAHSFSKDVAGEYGALVTDAGTNAGGWREITVSGLPADATFTFSVSGMQTVEADAYFYAPKGGRSATQSLIGMYEGETQVYAETAFSAEIPDLFSLTIRKEDSLTLEGLPDAVFEIANTEAFDDVVYTVTTDDDGYAVQGGLSEGIWYVREKTAPVGYIPYAGVFAVEVDAYTGVQRYKNTPYGGVQIIKKDSADALVAGAVFSVYAGSDVDADALLYEGLVTDADGVIVQGGLVPGTYTLVETAVPAGYHLDGTPVTVEIEPGEQAVITLVNLLIERGRLNLYKKDAETMRPLAGSVLGVYADADYTELIEQVVTLKTGPISVEELLPGTYYVRELEAPEGYSLDASDQTVVLAEGESRDVIFYNHEIPHTAGNYGLLLVAGGGAFMLLGVLAIVFRKRLFGTRP